ncbi:MAG: NAD(P)-dependent alcohol dehydrogenase [Nakamurella sp.]
MTTATQTRQTQALQADTASAPFKTATIERRELRPDDVRIDIKFAGICHSDIHNVRGEWGQTTFPIVPGHEITGIVSEIGSDVSNHKIGDRVGVGCFVDSCGECEACKDGEEQFCAKGVVQTYASKDYHDEITYGGYSQSVVVKDHFVVRIPDELDLAEATPLLCAGITTYAPLKRWGAGPGTQVAVIGMGGLGHVAVKIAAALGSEVSVLSRSKSKEADGKAFGATHYYATEDGAVFKDLASTFDLIINTVSADLDLNDYLGLLGRGGVMVNVGAPGQPQQFGMFSLLANRRIYAGSMVGGLQETQEMLDFCAEHHIAATIETIDAGKVDEYYDKVVDGHVRYRAVIDAATIGA